MSDRAARQVRSILVMQVLARPYSPCSRPNALTFVVVNGDQWFGDDFHLSVPANRGYEIPILPGRECRIEFNAMVQQKLALHQEVRCPAADGPLL